MLALGGHQQSPETLALTKQIAQLDSAEKYYEKPIKFIFVFQVFNEIQKLFWNVTMIVVHIN